MFFFLKIFFWDHLLFIHFNSFMDILIIIIIIIFPHMLFIQHQFFFNNTAQHLDLSCLKLVILKTAQHFKKPNFQRATIFHFSSNLFCKNF